MAGGKFSYDLNEFCVMAILSKGDSYGYQINQELLNVLDMSESTLYPVLRKLEREGIIQSYSAEHGGRLRKYCKLTPGGQRVLEDAKSQWRTLRDWIDQKFGEGNGSEQN